MQQFEDKNTLQNMIVYTSEDQPSPISLNNNIEIIAVYGGVSVCTILAMTIFCDVLLKRRNDKNPKDKKTKDFKQIWSWLAKILGLGE